MLAPMEELWTALEASLARQAPLALRALNPGAAEPLLRALRAHGASADLVESIRRHDGARVAGGVLGDLPRPRGAPWTRVTRWLPAEEALDETARVQHRIWSHPGCLVAARVGRLRPRDEMEGEPQFLLLVDKDGALFAAEELLNDMDPLSLMPLSVTWRGALASLSHGLESGSLIGSREQNVDRFATPPSAKPAPPPPRRPAESLVSLLVEVGALAPAAALDEARLRGLDAALRKRAPSERARAVLDEIRRSGAVVSPRLTEEALEALLARF